jgi:hypothetical protein
VPGCQEQPQRESRQAFSHLVEAICHHCSSHREEREASGASAGQTPRVTHGGEASWWWAVLHHWHVLHGLQTNTSHSLCARTSSNLSHANAGGIVFDTNSTECCYRCARKGSSFSCCVRFPWQALEHKDRQEAIANLQARVAPPQSLRHPKVKPVCDQEPNNCTVSVDCSSPTEHTKFPVLPARPNHQNKRGEQVLRGSNPRNLPESRQVRSTGLVCPVLLSTLLLGSMGHLVGHLAFLWVLQGLLPSQVYLVISIRSIDSQFCFQFC